MSKHIILLAVVGAALISFAACPASAQTASDASADYETLIFRAVRYGTTPEKRAQKKAAREELFARGPKALHEVMKRAHSRNVMVGVLAQELVERLPADQGAPVLVEFLTSTNSDTRRMAAFFLGFYNTPEYAPQVRGLLEDPEAAGAALRTLGKWKVRDAMGDIEAFLRHEREVRRIAAVNALRDIGDPRAIPLLEPCLQDRYFTVRRAAARAIAVLRAAENEAQQP